MWLYQLWLYNISMLLFFVIPIIGHILAVWNCTNYFFLPIKYQSIYQQLYVSTYYVIIWKVLHLLLKFTHVIALCNDSGAKIWKKCNFNGSHNFLPQKANINGFFSWNHSHTNFIYCIISLIFPPLWCKYISSTYKNTSCIHSYFIVSTKILLPTYEAFKILSA